MQTNSSSKIPVFWGTEVSLVNIVVFSEKFGLYFNRVQHHRDILDPEFWHRLSAIAQFFQRFKLAAANRPFKF